MRLRQCVYYEPHRKCELCMPDPVLPSMSYLYRCPLVLLFPKFYTITGELFVFFKHTNS